MKDDSILFDAWINPLAFQDVDEPWAKYQKENPGYNSILDYLCAPGINSDIDSLVTRYREISKETKRLFAAPAEEHILTKLVWPLRYAKGCYMLGNFLGTIALCGMVAEMIAILLFETSNISIDNKPLDLSTQVGLFGSSFEKLGQERRVSILRTYNLINEEIQSYFNIIRDKRRRYLHLYSQDFKQLAPDAVEVFNAILIIVTEIIGQDIHNGKIILKPAVLNYLRNKGLTHSIKNNPTDITQAHDSNNQI